MNEELQPIVGDEPPTQSLVAAPAGDRCVSCGSPLSSDQRYCVACGERRGTPRFALPVDATPNAPGSEGGAAAPPPRPPRASPGTTIVAGVGTLLLAMGVGVLIGRNSANVNAKPLQAAAPTVVTVAGGNGTSTSASQTATTAGKSSTGGKGTNLKASKAAKPTPAQAQKAGAAASKVLGTSNANLPPATVTVGATGHGPGYSKSGKFDGSFFGN